jgi:heptosyltransferase-2
VNWLGDAVMTTPALLRLRERFPNACILLLTPEKLVQLWQHHPAVDRVWGIPAEEGLWAAAARVREQNADLVLLLPNSHRVALEAWLARVPQRVGYSDVLRRWLLTHGVPRPKNHVRMRKRTSGEVRRRVAQNVKRETWQPDAHHIHHYLHLVHAVGGNPEPLRPVLVVSKDEVTAAAEKFGLTGTFPGAKPLFGINAGAEYGPAKRWPADRFVATASLVEQHVGSAWLVFGGAADMPLADEIEHGLRRAGIAARNVASTTSLRELCALLRLCRVLLTNDTGPMHVAAAVGTRVVVPFGSTAPELTGPGVPGDQTHKLLKGQAPCAPCFLRTCPIDLRCLRDIQPRAVAEAVMAAARA